MSYKTPPKSPVSKMPFRFLRGFSKKQQKSLKIAVVGAPQVGKSGIYKYIHTTLVALLPGANDFSQLYTVFDVA
jgi:hypothetical protein